MRYRVVIFDLFDTLVDFERDRLPLIHVNGKAIRSTTGVVYPLFAERYGQISLETFYRAFLESFHEAARIREVEEREVSARERFHRFFAKLQIPVTAEVEHLLTTLLETHMACIADAVLAPSERRELLVWLNPRYRLALISNFDHGPTARKILDRAEMTPFFEAILISEEMGWRKPHPAIFEAACHTLRITPEEAIFIGDSPIIDIVGAKRVGMGTIWVNRKGEPWDEETPPPDHTIASLQEVKNLL